LFLWFGKFPVFQKTLMYSKQFQIEIFLISLRQNSPWNIY